MLEAAEEMAVACLAGTFERIADITEGVRGTHYADYQDVPGTHRKFRRKAPA
jgi:hypothetical protein